MHVKLSNYLKVSWKQRLVYRPAAGSSTKSESLELLRNSQLQPFSLRVTFAGVTSFTSFRTKNKS